MGKDRKDGKDGGDRLECWEKEYRCSDCPADHPDNECSKFKKI